MRINDIIETCFTPEVYNREVAEEFSVTDKGDGNVKVSVTMRDSNCSEARKQMFETWRNLERSGYKVRRVYCGLKRFYLEVFSNSR